jgi:hypothetical protein
VLRVLERGERFRLSAVDAGGFLHDAETYHGRGHDRLLFPSRECPHRILDPQGSCNPLPGEQLRVVCAQIVPISLPSIGRRRVPRSGCGPGSDTLSRWDCEAEEPRAIQEASVA